MFLMSIYISICEFLITQTFCKKGVGGAKKKKGRTDTLKK